MTWLSGPWPGARGRLREAGVSTPLEIRSRRRRGRGPLEPLRFVNEKDLVFEWGVMALRVRGASAFESVLLFMGSCVLPLQIAVPSPGVCA